MDTKETNKEIETECEKMVENGGRNVKDEESEIEKEKEDPGLPIDRGWAWAVLAGKAMYWFKQYVLISS